MEQKLRRIPYYGVMLLLVYMPFHVFLAQWLSTITGGLSVWKGTKDAITALLVAFIIILVWQQRKANRLFNRFVIMAVAYGLLHFAVWALNPSIYKPAAILGTVYNNRLIWYLLIGMGAGLLLPKNLKPDKVLKIAIIISTIVCVLGILQYYLPKDILTHFGYTVARGVKPAFFIDDKPDLPRIMSTLKDPNSLGAFLILPITALFYQLVIKRDKRKMPLGGLLVLHVLALFLTFSRSAWLAVVVSLAVLIAHQSRKAIKPIFIKYWPLIIGVVLLGGSLLFSARNQYVVQNVIEHSDKSTTAQYDSNGYHLEYVKRGLKGMVDKPLGHGPGTAGIVSIQNPKGGLLTENYYVQIGYEVGIIGLLLFMAMNVLVYLRLLRISKSSIDHQGTSLSLILLASFWGYVVVNMLLHTWSNEAVALQWWLLAGLACTSIPHKRQTKPKA